MSPNTLPPSGSSEQQHQAEAEAVLNSTQSPILLCAETTVTVTLPDWLTDKLALHATGDSHLTSKYQNFSTDEARMQLAIDLSRENVQQNTGGPFGCAIYQKCGITGTYALVSVGVNRVVSLNNSTLHGETVAIQLAQKAIGCFTMGNAHYELYTSCEPCAMCLGATLWSGVSRLVCGAAKSDASAIGFDEGPVFEASYEHLKSAGIVVKRKVLRDEAAQVLREYGEIGVIYNSR
eukprot:CAMPEP_0196811382 /NCGR_PEP_ID=MMETSP1362-20130617/17112_1 /TAXON_ID=163516 /ORGANISM="Leptocylindrus danicus, Strain CCMP1856" /LENGTH=234 /DNA_ID=CAMNT_0042186669 /DNA_START=68 /DNA_END=772 /DNA_ORIENTATION=-